MPSRPRSPSPRLRRAALVVHVLVLPVVLATAGRADTGVAGGWHVVYGPHMLPALMFVKEAADGTLSVHLEGTEGSGAGTGTFDPATRTLHVVSGPGGGIGGNCGVLSMDASVAADGGTMQGTLTFGSLLVTSHCGLIVGNFTATHSACGNGVVDPGESCDAGDYFSDFDCCSTECTLEQAGSFCALPELAPCTGFNFDSHCDGTSMLCPPVGPTDFDGDGIPDTCDDCSGTSRLLTLRVHRRRAPFSITARLAVADRGFDPVANGMRIVLRNEPSEHGVSFIGLTDDAGHWAVKHPGRSWRFRTKSGRKPSVIARVRFAHDVAAVRARIAHVSDIARLRFVTVQYAVEPTRVCGDADLSTSACVVRTHTTVCRALQP